MAYPLIMQDDNLRRGPWLEEEDERLIAVVAVLGERRWDALAKASGLKRSGKSCRLRWMNYLRPNLKHGNITPEEERLIIQLQKQWGNKWSKIARRLPGRTDNEIKNYWRTQLRKKAAVQEQEHFCRIITNNFENNQSNTKCDSLSPCSSSDDCVSRKDDVLGSSAPFSAADELSNCAYAFSPYESRLSDWLSEECNMENDGDHWCNSLDSTSLCYSEELISGCIEISLWDSSYIIWNVD